MFQVHIWWNEIENNAKKMHLYKMFEVDVLKTPQWRYPTGFFLGHFEIYTEPFSKTVRIYKSQLFSNMFWIMLKIYVLGTPQGRHYADVNLGCN